jgi:RNA polymerase sigma factor (TIGR02999 family)
MMADSTFDHETRDPDADAGRIGADMLPQIYEELRQLAHQYMRGESGDNTLQPTALVHEAYARIVRAESAPVSRDHLFAIAATAMRQLLIDHARRKQAAKRGGGWDRITLADVGAGDTGPVDLIDLADALEELATLDEVQSRIVDLRYLAGMSIPETAEVLGLSTSKVERETRAARAWLLSRLSRGDRA